MEIGTASAVGTRIPAGNVHPGTVMFRWVVVGNVDDEPRFVAANGHCLDMRGPALLSEDGPGRLVPARRGLRGAFGCGLATSFPLETGSAFGGLHDGSFGWRGRMFSASTLLVLPPPQSVKKKNLTTRNGAGRLQGMEVLMNRLLFSEADATGRAISVPAYKEAMCGCDLKRANLAIMRGHGAALRCLREKAGLSQDAVGHACDVSKQLVSDWEMGKAPVARTHWPTLAQLYGLTVGEIAAIGLPLAGETRDPIAARDPWAVGLDSDPLPSPNDKESQNV